MSDDGDVVVRSYSTHEMAEAAVSLLASEGVSARIRADDAGGELPNLDAIRGARVVVAAADVEFARGLLGEGEGEGETAGDGAGDS